MFSSTKILRASSQPYKDVKYDTIDDEESTSSLHSEPQPERIARHSKLTAFLGGTGLACLLLISFLLGHYLVSPASPKYIPDSVPDEEWNHCGRSSVDAMKRGCVMEPLFYGWMPPQCVFQQLTAQFPVFEDRTWYQDVNKTIPLPSSDLWEGKHKLIYTTKYHSEHCLFQWRKLQYAYSERMEWLDNKTVSGGHTGHCADQLTMGYCNTGADDVNTVELGFYRCRKTLW